MQEKHYHEKYLQQQYIKGKEYYTKKGI